MSIIEEIRNEAKEQDAIIFKLKELFSDMSSHAKTWEKGKDNVGNSTSTSQDQADAR